MNNKPSKTMDIRSIREHCPKFRVLIVGKANAGKTTILQKVCNTTEEPIVSDPRGRRMSFSLLKPSKGRGVHDIKQELVFKGRDDFIFHDSRGFEAGSKAELDRVKDFIQKRSRQPQLRKRLHAVWYCIPSDTPRMLLDDETSFFEECKKGNVPVVAIFTKVDYQHKEAMAKFMEEGLDRKAAKLAAPSRARVDLETLYKNRLYERPYPPQKHVFLHDMHLPTSTCDELIHATIDALSDTSLKLLFISTQQNRIELCVEYAIRHILVNQHVQARGPRNPRRHEMKDIVYNCMIWFPLNQQDLEEAVITINEQDETVDEMENHHVIKKKWRKFKHPWEHWWAWDSPSSTGESHWSSQWIHEVLFSDTNLEKMAGQGTQRILASHQIARLATITVVILSYICSPLPRGMEGTLQRTLNQFLDSGSQAFDSLTESISVALTKWHGDPFSDLATELKRVALEHRL